uniref:Putative secreted protein n=1 Tax=Ixodes ricinus TaxID=34613 RepID=A0A147BAQ7_IXORI
MLHLSRLWFLHTHGAHACSEGAQVDRVSVTRSEVVKMGWPVPPSAPKTMTPSRRHTATGQASDLVRWTPKGRKYTIIAKGVTSIFKIAHQAHLVT